MHSMPSSRKTPRAEGSATLSKAERIKSSLTIKTIVGGRLSCSSYPLKCFWRQIPYVETAAQVAVVVSKRRFKRAVDRNAIKRKMREAYRLQKQMIGEHPNTTLQMCWIYIGKEIPAMETLFKAAVALFEKINNAIMEGEQ